MFVIIVNLPFISSTLITLIVKIMIGVCVYCVLILVSYRKKININMLIKKYTKKEEVIIMNRKIEIEILRIVSIFMIIILHLNNYGFNLFTLESGSFLYNLSWILKAYVCVG